MCSASTLVPELVPGGHTIGVRVKVVPIPQPAAVFTTSQRPGPLPVRVLMFALPMHVWPAPVGGIVDTKLNTAVVPVTKTVTDMAAPVVRFRPVPMNWLPPLESKKKTNWSVKGRGEKQKGPMGAAFAGVPTHPSSPTTIATITNNLFMASS